MQRQSTHLLSSTACDQLWLLEISSDREPFPSLGCRRPCVSTSCLCLEPYQPPCEQAQHCAYSICNARWRAERAGLAGQTAFPALVTSPMFPPPCGYPSCVPTPTWLPVLCSHPCPVTSPVFSSTPSYQSPVPTLIWLPVLYSHPHLATCPVFPRCQSWQPSQSCTFGAMTQSGQLFCVPLAGTRHHSWVAPGSCAGTV